MLEVFYCASAKMIQLPYKNNNNKSTFQNEAEIGNKTNCVQKVNRKVQGVPQSQTPDELENRHWKYTVFCITKMINSHLITHHINHNSSFIRMQTFLLDSF